MVTEPAAIPVTKPVLDTVAIAVLLDVQPQMGDRCNTDKNRFCQTLSFPDIGYVQR